MTWTYGNVLRILCELYPDTMIMLMKEDIQNGITLEILMTKKHKKTPCLLYTSWKSRKCWRTQKKKGFLSSERTSGDGIVCKCVWYRFWNPYTGRWADFLGICRFSARSNVWRIRTDSSPDIDCDEKIIKIQKEIKDRERGRKCGFSLSGSMFFCISGRICGFDCRRRRTDLTSGIYDCGTAGTYLSLIHI